MIMWKYIASLLLAIPILFGYSDLDVSAMTFDEVIKDKAGYFKVSPGDDYDLEVWTFMQPDTRILHYIRESDGTHIFRAVGEDTEETNEYMGLYYSLDGGNTWESAGLASAAWIPSEINYFTANVDIFERDGGFFFNVPRPIVTEERLAVVPTTIMQTLVDGGLILVALVILAIMLGVLLVRRFPSWFLR